MVTANDLCLCRREIEVRGKAVTYPVCRLEKLRPLIEEVRDGKTGGQGFRRDIRRAGRMRTRAVRR